MTSTCTSALRQLRQRVGERFRRTALVRLDEQLERALLAFRGVRDEVLERHRALARAAALRLAIEALAPLRDFARLGGVFHDEELVAGHRHADHAEHLHRNRRPRFLHRLAALVEHRAHAPGEQAADEVVADVERAVLHEHGRDRPLARRRAALR